MVAGGAVAGTFSDLEAAKAELNKNTSGFRLIVEVKDGEIMPDPHMIAGQAQTPENGFNKVWRDWGDINSMIAVAKASMETEVVKVDPSQTPVVDPPQTPLVPQEPKTTFTISTVLFGPTETESIGSYAKAVEFCTGKGHTLASIADACQGGKPTFGQPDGDQWMPVSDSNNEWIQVGTAHTLCQSHNQRFGPPDWGVSEDKMPFEANYVLCLRKEYKAYVQTLPPPKPRPHSPQSVFSTCKVPGGQKGLIPNELDPIAKCYNLFNSPLEAVKQISKGVMVEVAKFAGENQAMDDIVDIVFHPVDVVMDLVMDKIKDAVPFDASFCAGDFDAETIASPDEDNNMVGLCGDLPLSGSNDGEWTVMAGMLDLDEPIAMSVCPGLKSVKMQFCLAVSMCDIIPSIAFMVDAGLAR